MKTLVVKQIKRSIEIMDEFEGGDLYLINGNMLPLKKCGCFCQCTYNMLMD